ncbi:MAG: phospholipase [Firmicutes bacterium]|nr:phospholipase [Bacillota bacterium]
MKGLFLQGGGAKGAFQAGVIYGLYEKGFKFKVITGTSIGAINSYFIYTDNIKELKNTWTNLVINGDNEKIHRKKVIENQELMNVLKKFNGINDYIKSVYINYVEVKNKKLKERVVDITKLNKKEQIKAIKYSSLLPCRDNQSTKREIMEKFDSQRVFEEFKIDLSKGLYEGYNLDGGILNNDFLRPFTKDKVDKLYLITFKNNYKIPKYIFKHYNKEDIVVIEPRRVFKPNDTLRFNKEFLIDIFNEGYEISKNIS